MKTVHTPGAMRAAEIVMNGKKTIPTIYGTKTATGIADLIEKETAAPELLAACKVLVSPEVNADGRDSNQKIVLRITNEQFNQISAAIAKSEGR